MQIQPFIQYYGSIIAIVIRLFSCVILLFFMIPLQYKELRVKNGLRKLRIQLLSIGILLLCINIVRITSLIITFLTRSTPDPLAGLLQIINGIFFVIVSLIGLSMYTSQYSEENIEHHQKIEDLEKKEAGQEEV